MEVRGFLYTWGFTATSLGSFHHLPSILPSTTALALGGCYNYLPLRGLVSSRALCFRYPSPCSSLVKNLKTLKNRPCGKTCLVGKEYYRDLITDRSVSVYPTGLPIHLSSLDSLSSSRIYPPLDFSGYRIVWSCRHRSSKSVIRFFQG
jgi:hypothetical protein